MSDQTLKIAMIGCGGNARGHMSRLLQLPGVEIVGLCDTADAAIEAARNLDPSIAKATVFGDYRELLASVDCDAIEISTPHTCHFDQIIASLSAGKHVLCEKPMVCQVDHAHAVIEKISQTGLTFAVSYQRHTLAPYRFCRELIASGEIGKLTFITALQSQNWYTGRMSSGDWRGIKALSGGGQLNDSGSHLIDIVLWMSGLQPAEVFAFQDNLEAEVDIMSALSVKFDGGALLNLSVVGHAVNWFEEITMWTENSCLAIRDDSVVWKFEGQTRHVLSGADLGEASSDPDANFVNSIRGTETPQATAEDALKVIQLSEATWRSAEQGVVAKVIR
ncbi:MAG: Gfo/Idh/MocA family oxidoreductase [Armatimonadota bacterium]